MSYYFSTATSSDLEKILLFRRKCFPFLEKENSLEEEKNVLSEALKNNVRFFYCSYHEELQYIFKIEKLKDSQNIYYGDSLCGAKKAKKFLFIKFIKDMVVTLALESKDSNEVQVYYRVPTFFGYIYKKRIDSYIKILNNMGYICSYKWVRFRRVFVLYIKKE